MLDDSDLGSGVIAEIGDGRSLDAFLGILEGVKIGDGTAAHPLEAGADPGLVHHLEHDLDALSFFPQEFPVTPSVVTKVYGAGRAPVEAHLLFYLGDLVVVFPAQSAVVVNDIFGKQIPYWKASLTRDAEYVDRDTPLELLIRETAVPAEKKGRRKKATAVAKKV